jgi:FKBP-type peptidyl-prolyl cis-trans isomerase
MKFWIWALVFAVFEATKTPPTELQIGIKKRAETCTYKSKNGDMLSMHYTGSLFDTGEVFDSSLERKQPFDFVIGKGQVIKGWEQGLLDMCEGEKRKVIYFILLTVFYS